MPDDRTVTVRLRAMINDYVAKMSAAASVTRQFGAELNQATKTEKGRQNLDKVTDRAAILGAGLTSVAVAAVKLSSDFDSAMSKVKSNVDDKSAPAMAKLKAAALDAGKSTQYSAIQAAEAEDELAKAGIGVRDIVSGGLKGALNLAAAGQLDVASAAEIAASAMTQFGLSGKDIPHIADLLAAGADKAQGSVQDLGNALKYVGPVAASMGVSIETTTGVLTEFANQGIIGEQAGTSLRGMLSSLSSPTQQARAEMQKLGIQLYDGKGRFIGMGGAAQQLHDKLGGLTGAQRDAALGILFGNEQVTAARVLMNGGAAAVRKYTAAVDDQGFAAKSAGTKMDNLAGDLQHLKSALETTLIESGSGATSGLRKLAQGATAAVDAFGDLPSGVQEALVVVAGISGVALLAAAGLGKLKSIVGDVQESLSSFGTVGSKLSAGVGAVAKWTPVAGAAALAVVGLGLALKHVLDDSIKPAKHDVDDLSKSLITLSRTGQTVGTANVVLGKNLDVLKRLRAEGQKVVTTYNNFGQAVNRNVVTTGAQKAAAQYAENLKETDKALTGLVKSGNINAARGAYEKLREEWQAAGLPMKELNKGLATYLKTAAQSGPAAEAAGKGFGTASQNADTLANSLEAAVKQGQTLIDVWDQLNGAMASTDSAMLAAVQAGDALKKSLEDNGKSFSRNTEAGLKNRTALEDYSKKAAQAAEATLEESGSVNQATKTWNRYKKQAEETLVQMGLTRAEARALVNQMFQFPSDIKVPVSTPGSKGSKSELEKLKEKEAAIKEKIKIAIHDNAGASSQRVKDLQDQLNKLHDREIYIKTHMEVYHTDYYTAYRTDAGGKALVDRANGGLVDYYAGGGIREHHLATIAPAGAMRVWAEPETGGEAYIPLAPSKRARSIPIWEETGRRLGISIGQMPPVVVRGGDGASAAAPVPAPVNRTINIYPQRADFTLQDLRQAEYRQDILERVGRQ